MHRHLNILRDEFRASLKPAVKTVGWLLSIMVPVSFGVGVLRYLGLLGPMSAPLQGVFRVIGLPGEAALVFVISIFVNIYSAIAVLVTLSFSLREATIMALMCLISHNLIVETSVVRRTGSHALVMLAIRLSCSFIGALLLNAILPGRLDVAMGDLGVAEATKAVGVEAAFLEWLVGAIRLSVRILLIVVGLTLGSRLLERYGAIRPIARVLRPFLRLMGLPEVAAFQWVVANTLGLAYGAAVMVDSVESGRLDRSTADLLNHHLVVSHSLVEDTLLFVAIGVGAVWITIPRLLLATTVVWLRRLVPSPNDAAGS